MRKYIKTAIMTMKNHTNPGILYLIPENLMRVVYLMPLIMLWRTFMAKGVDVGMSVGQMLTYTYISALLRDLLLIQSPLTHWIMDGPLVGLYQRPIGIYGHVIAQSLGDAMPGLALFSLPMLGVSTLLGISVTPASIWFLPSLALSVSLGFAFEFLFACLIVYMINASWLVYVIRNAIIWTFSGSFIPFVVLPFNLGGIMRNLPLGSLGGAPLAIYVGTSNVVHTMGMQIFWNMVMWPIAILSFRKAQERLTSHGG